MAKYALEVHRAWLYLVRGTPRIPMSLPYSSLPQAMVVEVILLQITVCTFPVDCTVVKQLRSLSGQRQITFVEEPETGARAAAVVDRGAGGDPGRQSVIFFVMVVIFITPGTGWKKRVL